MFSTTVSCGTIETRPIMHREPKDMDFNSKKKGGGDEGAHAVVFVTSLFCIGKKKKMDLQRSALNTGRHSFH